MLCQDCNQKESTVHLTQIVNNKKVVLNLCRDCAEKRGFHSPFENMPFPLAEFVTGMVGVGKKPLSKAGRRAGRVKKCPTCGMTFDDFGKIGRLGCGQCYVTFNDGLSDLLRKIHGSCDHRGKIPAGTEDTMKPIREERVLREELKKAVEKENFEEAARLRDKIKELSGKI